MKRYVLFLIMSGLALVSSGQLRQQEESSASRYEHILTLCRHVRMAQAVYESNQTQQGENGTKLETVVDSHKPNETENESFPGLFVECSLIYMKYHIQAMNKDRSVLLLLTSWLEACKNFFFGLANYISSQFGNYELLIIFLLVALLILCLFILSDQLVWYVWSKERPTLISVRTV